MSANEEEEQESEEEESSLAALIRKRRFVEALLDAGLIYNIFYPQSEEEEDVVPQFNFPPVSPEDIRYAPAEETNERTASKVHPISAEHTRNLLNYPRQWKAEFPPLHMVYEPACYTLGCLWRGGTIEAAATASNRTLQAYALSQDINRTVNMYANQVFDNLRRLLPRESAALSDEEPFRSRVMEVAIRGIQRTINALIEIHYLELDEQAAVPPRNFANTYKHSDKIKAGWASGSDLPTVLSANVDAWLRRRNIPGRTPPLLRAWIVAKGSCRACCTPAHAVWTVDDLNFVVCPVEWNPYKVRQAIRVRFPLLDPDVTTMAGDLLEHPLTMAWFHTPLRTSIFQSKSMRQDMSPEMLAAIFATTVHAAADLYNQGVVDRVTTLRQLLEPQRTVVTRDHLVFAADVAATVGFSRFHYRPRLFPVMQPQPQPGNGAPNIPLGVSHREVLYHGQGDSDVVDAAVRAIGTNAIQRSEITVVVSNRQVLNNEPHVRYSVQFEEVTEDRVVEITHALELSLPPMKQRTYHRCNTPNVGVLPSPTLNAFTY